MTDFLNLRLINFWSRRKMASLKCYLQPRGPGRCAMRLGSHKASTCRRIKTQCHCLWLLSQPSLSAMFRESESGLIPCFFSPSPAGFGELPLDQTSHRAGNPDCFLDWRGRGR